MTSFGPAAMYTYHDPANSLVECLSMGMQRVDVACVSGCSHLVFILFKQALSVGTERISGRKFSSAFMG